MWMMGQTNSMPNSRREENRADMKQTTLSKLDRLVDVAARQSLEHDIVEDELAKAAANQKPDDKLLTRAEWEAITKSWAENGRRARELAQQEYDERRVRPENAERSRAEKKKRDPAARNLDGQDGGGWAASLGAERQAEGVGVPVAALHYLRDRERLSTANAKEPLRATRLSAPSGNDIVDHDTLCPRRSQSCPIRSTSTVKQILFEEQYVANLEALKDEFGLLTSATTTPRLLKAMLNALYVRSVDDIVYDIVLPRTLELISTHRTIVLAMGAATLFITVSAYGTMAGLWGYSHAPLAKNPLI